MRNSIKAGLVGSTVLAFSGVAAQATPAFINPNFTSIFSTSTYVYSVPITGWNDVSGAGSASGISAAVPNSLWDNGVAPDGETNVAFLQNATAAFQQTVVGFIVGHKYQIEVTADARAATGFVGLSLGVDGVELGADLLTPGPVQPIDAYGVYATPWATYASAVFTATTVSSLIQIQNQGIPGSTSFNDVTIDLGNATIVDVTPPGGVTSPGVPEPASWALMLTGVGLIGSTLRRRHRAPAS